VKRIFSAAALCLACAACAPPASRPPARGRVRVAAASDLNVALGEIVARFSATHNADVSVSYGSSGTFYTQLLNQAPFDVYLSADVEYPRQLTSRGLTLDDGPFTYALGRLVMWVPSSSPLDIEHDGLQALADPSVAHVAVANPGHAPYGRAAIAALKGTGLYDRMQSKLVFGENVAQALQFAQSGAADGAIVALSLALAPALEKRGRYVDVPSAMYPRMEQGGAILKWAADVETARALRAFIVADEGRAILERSGFALPDR